MLTTAQRVTALQAMACERRNHDHVVTAWKSWSKAAGHGFFLWSMKPMKRMVVELGFQESNWGSIRNLLTNRLPNQGPYGKWASALITAIFVWSHKNQIEFDFEGDEESEGAEASCFTFNVNKSSMELWYKRCAPTVRITILRNNLKYTLAEGAQRELSWNQQLHLVLPPSFKAEHPTLNLYFAQAEQDLNIAWRIDSAEFTLDLVSLIEGKNCINCHDIFSQIGDQGR